MVTVSTSELEAMRHARQLAQKALLNGDVPVGAVVLNENGHIIGQGWNTREAENDPSGHAEIMALKNAATHQKSWRINTCTLVVTLEPCLMCAGAAIGARIGKIVFGTWDEKAGACGSLRDVVRDNRLNHKAQVVGGVQAKECQAQIESFFSSRRAPTNPRTPNLHNPDLRTPTTNQ